MKGVMFHTCVTLSQETDSKLSCVCFSWLLSLCIAWFW